MSDVPTGHLSGIPATDARSWHKTVLLLRRLPELRRRLTEIDERLAALESSVKPSTV